MGAFDGYSDADLDESSPDWSLSQTPLLSLMGL
jgi:hypothetical protein